MVERVEVATCKHCSERIDRGPGAPWWTHTKSRLARCAPGNPRNAQMADPAPGWARSRRRQS
jgi:hypothetical protein